MTAQDTAGLVADLRLAERVFNEDAEDHAACLVGTLARRAADALEVMWRELAEVRQEAQDAVLSMIFMPGVRAALDALPDDDPIEPYLKRIRDLEAAERLLSESQAEGRRKDEALEPFAKVLKGNWSKQSDDAPIVAGMNQYDLRLNLKLGDFRRARTALAARDQGDGR